ncbi:MAG: nucleotidyltransferase [Sphaerobacteraceae bacterium]|nr:MAG: nucleotidyltransferase [Sphaerobacteraceae bacterium]
MTRARIDIPQDQIAEFCRRHRIKRLSLFGSVLRDDFTDESDIDVLVEFEEGYTPGLHFFGLDHELSAIIGRPAEVHTPGFISDYFRDEVVREAEVQYDVP